MMRAAVRLSTLFLVAALPNLARATPDLPLPTGAQQTAETNLDNADFALPVGPWEQGKTPTVTLTGTVHSAAWRVPANGPQTTDLMQSLRASLLAQGYQPIFACATDACGGFDFRFGLDLMSEPEMHVDLSDFRFLSATKGRGDKAEYLALTVSRAGETAFVQLTSIGGGSRAPVSAAALPQPAAPLPPQPPAPPSGAATNGLETALAESGHVTLSDLTFGSGSAELSAGQFASLSALSAYLAAHPQAQVLIVGHTDISGALAANLALSQQRAQSVVTRLIADYGVAPGQLAAAGAGPLSPVTSNGTAEGRQKNRRVEAVLASTR